MGNNFGIGGGTVTIGGTPCPVVSLNHTHVICTVPAGTGVNRQVVVTVGGPSSTQPVVFSYDPPVITSVNPLSSLTDGNIVITVRGTSFSSTGFVTINGQTCVSVSVIDTQIQCRVGVRHALLLIFVQSLAALACSLVSLCVLSLQAGVGLMLPVVVNVGSRQSNAFFFNYTAPTLSLVSPSAGTTLGGTSIVLTGTSFGTSGSVTIGTAVCTPVPGQWFSTSVTCTTPAGGGLNLPVRHPMLPFDIFL